MSQNNPATEDKVSQIIAGYMRRIDQGEKVDQQKFIAEFPEVKSNLEQYFQNVAMVENLAGPTTAEQASIKQSPAARETFNQGSLVDSVAPKSIKKKAAQSTVRKGKFGRYQILKSLGEGAMGNVYLALDTELEREIALKIPKIDDSESEEKLIKRFYEEARSAAILLHRGICPVYDVGSIDGTCYIAMAYIPGLPLSEHLTLGTFKPLKKTAELICKAAIALSAAHQQGVIHRDLKPANIMVNEEHEPIIMDFGLARQLHKQDASRITVAGTVMGSPAYMSPEQVSGKIDSVGKQSDIYNLGVILYEMLTGQLPFDGPVMVIIGQIIATEPEKPSSIQKRIDPKLEAICLKMMAKKKEDRYQSMQEVAEALSEYTKGASKNSSSKSIIEFSDELINQLSGENTPIDEEDLLPLPAKYKKNTKKTSSYRDRKSRGNSGITKTALLALLPIAMVLAVIVFTIKSGDRTVEIVIDDPTAQISIDGNQVNINGLAGNVNLDVGPHELTVTKDGVTVSGWDKFAFTVKKDDKNILTIALLDLDPPIEKTPAVKEPAPKTVMTKQTPPADDKPILTSTPMPVDTINIVADSDSWIDLIARVDLEQDVLGGTWLKTINGLELLKGEEQHTLIQLPANIRGSYELELEITRHEISSQYGVNLVIPVGNQLIHPCFSGWGINHYSGLVYVDEISTAPELLRYRTDAFQIAKDKRHNFNLRVEVDEPQAKVTAFADGKELFAWHGNILDLALCTEHYNGRIKQDSYILLDCFGPGKLTVHKLRWRQLEDVKLEKTKELPEFVELDLVDDTESFQKFAELKPGESTYSEKHFELINRLQAESVSQRRDTLEEIKSLTWPADRFLRKRIPEDMLAAAGGGDASKAPKEIVALLGDPRLNCWSSVLDLRLIDKEQTVLAAHEDGTVSFHDMKSGRLIEIRKCHAHQVHSIAISPDEKTYATGGDDGAVTLWNRSSGQELITYKNHTSETYDVQFSPDEQWFASAAADGLICIYSQARQQRPIHILQPGGPVHDVQFLNQGDLLASASGDATLRIWDVKSGKQVKALTGHSGEVWVLSVSDSANRLASIDSEGKAIIWNTTNWSIVKTLNTEGTVYSKIRLSHDGKKLAVRVHNYSRNTTSLWDIESGIRVKQSLHPGGWGVFSLRFSKNDEVLVSGHRPGRIAIRDLASESFRFTKVEGPELLKGELSGDGTQLGIVHRGEFQHTWDFNKCIFRRTKATRSGNHCIATSFDGKFYVTAGGTYKPAKVDIESGKVVGVGYPAHAARVHAIQYSHDGTKIASVASDIRLLLWDAQLKEKIIIDCKGMSRLRAVTFSPDDKLVAVSGKSGKVQIRETSKGGLIATFDGKIGESHALLFSPDGKRLLQGLGNGNINIWDLATNKLVGTLKGHQATILSIKISPDGKKLASSASDGAVRFWDIKSGKNIRTIQLSPTGRGNVYIAGFTPEGRHLITTCANGMAYVLRL